MKLSILALTIGTLVMTGCTERSTVENQTTSNNQTAVVDVVTDVVTEVGTKTENSAVETILSVEQVLPNIPDAEKQLTQSERFARFVEQLKKQAAAQGISQPTIDKAFANVHIMMRVIASDKNQLEKKVTLDDYLQRVLTARRIAQAQEKYKLHAAQLATQSQRYGVQASYIVALWGMESNFGRLQGKEDIISAMTTLAFEGRREAFFTAELMAALQILEQGHVDADNLKGSWAGAMGQSQFMPSSFIKYGADGDGDGRIDIWNNVNDVFASTANYLSTEGWDPSVSWGREVKLAADFDSDRTGLENDKAKTVAQWQKLGVEITGANDSELKQKAWIILPDDSEGRAFLVYSNFKTLMHWNRSYYFAISVGMLADSMTQ